MSFRQAGFVAVLLAIPAALTVPATAAGQNPDSVTILGAVRVTVSRDAARSTLELPYAVSRLELDSTRAATRRASLTEALLFVPGVSVSHRYNPTQDPRLTIRGFGARSAFGIRGVRVLRDGIPLTAADGQTAVDFLDLESLGAVEVFRGSAGALYGNSSGGVVDFRTTPPPDAGGRARVSGWFSGGISRASVSAGQRLGDLGLQGTLTRNAGDGPRDYSSFESTNAMGDARWTALGGTGLQLQASFYDAPEAENPGALTLAEMERDPTLPDSNNIVKKASKSVRQSMFSLQAARDIGSVSLLASGQVGWRDLVNPQSFAYIELDRQTAGGSVRAQYTGGSPDHPLRLAIGADLLNQTDDRQNYTNCAGLTGANRPAATCPTLDDRGSLTVNQEERVAGLGAYVRGELAVTSRLSVTGTVRGDRTRFEVTDRRATDPALAEPPPRTLSAVSPMLGINWRIGTLSAAYASVSTSFETPTTTELANRPEGVGGLNADLKPQRGVSYEVGYKGAHTSGIRYDLALFTIVTEDELIPFQVPGAATGRVFFRNAGQTTRRGAEASIASVSGPVSVGATATWLRYVYDEFVVAGTSFTGNRVPGVAPVTVSAFASVQPRWGLASIEAVHAGRLAVNNANTAWADGYYLLNARLAFRAGTRLSMEPVVGIDNVFDRTWASNVVVNAAGGRYYEPGPGRTYYVGVRMGTR
jgi:iron complex outermembrane receptor protein